MTDRELMHQLRRHVGHQLRCARETSGDVSGFTVETVVLRCEDCGEVVLEATKKIHKRTLASR
jgi:hypothetical protein